MIEFQFFLGCDSADNPGESQVGDAGTWHSRNQTQNIRGRRHRQCQTVELSGFTIHFCEPQGHLHRQGAKGLQL